MSNMHHVTRQSVHLGVSIVFVGSIIWFMQLLHPTWVHPLAEQILLFYAGIGIVNLMVLKAQEPGTEGYTFVLLITVIVRFISAGGYVLWQVQVGLKQPLLFVVNFFVIYLFMVWFEIYSIMANLRPQNEN